ncbi:hypothetical protein H0W91_00835 [Patescibacteria group bacterium]|nr:hypothetical protein [Patescibacteria group bacterium]
MDEVTKLWNSKSRKEQQEAIQKTIDNLSLLKPKVYVKKKVQDETGS